jgi:hypothetical protein
MDLTVLDGAHAGEDVWVVGSDASLDWFPDGFWVGRTVVCVNEPHVPCRYVVSKADSDGRVGPAWLAQKVVECPDVVFVVSRHPNGSRRIAPVELSGPNVVLFEHHENRVADFVADRDIPGERGMLLVSWSTLGSAMHLAARMGARTVFMAGVSGGAFGGAESLSARQGAAAGPIQQMSAQTQPIADRLRVMYGTEFVTVVPWANLRLGGTTFSADYGRLN